VQGLEGAQAVLGHEPIERDSRSRGGLPVEFACLFAQAGQGFGAVGGHPGQQGARLVRQRT